jgi:pentatricopeptide repeat protein
VRAILHKGRRTKYARTPSSRLPHRNDQQPAPSQLSAYQYLVILVVAQWMMNHTCLQFMAPIGSIKHVQIGSHARGSRMLMELNLVCYNAVLTAWARSQDGGRQAEALLPRMPMAPDAISWSAVLTAWASSARQPQGIQRAEALLRKAYGSGHSVDQSCFNTLLHAYGRHGQVDRAEHMLKQWVETVVTGVSSSKLVPDRFSFNIVLNAIAKRGRDDAGRQAQTRKCWR